MHHIVNAVQPIDTKIPDITHHAERTFMNSTRTMSTSAEPCSASLVAAFDDAREVVVRGDLTTDRRRKIGGLTERIASASIGAVRETSEAIPHRARLERQSLAGNDVAAHHFGDAHGIFVGSLEDDEAHRGASVVAARNLLVGETLRDLGDVADSDDLAGGGGPQRDLANRVGPFSGAEHANADIRAAGAHRARRDLGHPRLHHIGNLRQPQTEASERGAIDIDADLVRPRASHDDRAHARQRAQVIAHALSGTLERLLARVAEERHDDHGEIRLELGDAQPL